MKKNILFCFLFVFMSLMSHNSFASIVTYYLDGDLIYDDLDGFITYESVGIPRLESDIPSIGWSAGYVDFKVYEFFLERDNDVLVHNFNKANDNISFMVNGITDGSLVYSGDRVYFPTFNSPTDNFLFFRWIYEAPEDGSLIFAPNAFGMQYDTYVDGFQDFIDGTVHAMSTVSAVDEPVYALSMGSAVDETVYAMPSISEVDEPGVFTFVLYGLLFVCLIAVIKRTNIIKC